MMNFKYIIFSIICFFLTLFSIVVIRVEYLSLYRNDHNIKKSDNNIFDKFEYTYGYSSYSKFIILNNCLIGMQITVNDELLIRKKENLVDACFKVTMRIIAKMPSNSFAWYIHSLSGILKGDSKTANFALNQSYVTAPNEGWLAQQRIIFFEKNEFLLAPKMRDIYMCDLKLLGFGAAGLEYLVRRYLSEPLIQPIIADIMEELPPARQVQFLSLMKMQK